MFLFLVDLQALQHLYGNERFQQPSFFFSKQHVFSTLASALSDALPCGEHLEACEP